MQARIRAAVQLLALVALFPSIPGCAWRGSHFITRAERGTPLHGTFGTYDAEPRGANGRVDVQRLVNELTAMGANTYNFLIWHAATDWDDLQRFLPLARARNINVWVTIVPPSESPPRAAKFSEPFRLDYEQWAVEIAKLSRREPNLVAWSVDDFSENTGVFTPERVERIQERTLAINPWLAFAPCCYYRQITPEFARRYGAVIEGVLFPYRHESGEMNLRDAGAVEIEVAHIKSLFTDSMPVFVDVYASRHSQLQDSTPGYVGQVMMAASRSADGVLIYCHQTEAANPDKYRVIRNLFEYWRKKGWKK